MVTIPYHGISASGYDQGVVRYDSLVTIMRDTCTTRKKKKKRPVSNSGTCFLWIYVRMYWYQYTITTSPCIELDINCLFFCFFLQQLRRAHWVVLLSSGVVQSELLEGIMKYNPLARRIMKYNPLCLSVPKPLAPHIIKSRTHVVECAGCMAYINIPAYAHGMMRTTYIPEHLVCRNATVKISNCLHEIIIPQSLTIARSPLDTRGSGALKK